jgi:hypothetical protein
MSEATAVVPAESKEIAPAQPTYASKFQDAFRAQVWSSFDPETPEGKAAIISHLDGADADALGKLIGEVIEVQHVLAHRVTVIDDDGVEVEADRLVLVGPDGESVSCTSTGILRSLQVIMGLYGMPPFKPALKLKIRQKDTRRGRRIYSLVPVMEAEVTPTSKKK